MPELSKDPFGDVMARAFYMRESPLDQQALFYPPVMYKPVHQESQKSLGLSTHLPPFHSIPPAFPLPEPDAFLLRATSFLPLETDGSHLQQGVGGYSTYSVPHYQPQQLEVPEIEECSTWMSDVLDDFPAISTQELSPLASTANVSFDGIAPPDFSSSIDHLPIPQLALPSPPEDESVATPPHPSPTTSKGQAPVVSSPKALTPYDVAITMSPTPKPLKPRGPRRFRKALEEQKKLKKGVNEEQKEHVRRERQRRDDMSLKISTLESLLPPAGPNLKRDRASIVHDSVHYVKSLQEKVEELKKTFSEMKLSKSTRPAPRSDPLNVTNPASAASTTRAHLVEYHIQVEGEGEVAARLEKCRCRPDYMSSAMKVFERLNLDVYRCNITKMCDYTLCVIIAKPRLTSSQVATSAAVVSSLRSSLQLL